MAEKTQTRRGPLGWVKRHKKLTIFLAILLVAALVLVNVLGKTDKAAADSYQFVRTTVLTKTTLSDTVSVTGTVKAGSSASVTASDSVKTYKVTAVNVAVGDTVRKGDVIATLDTTDVEKQIANAQLQLSDTRTDARKNYTQAVEDQTTNLATAQENLDKAQKNYDTLGMDDYYTSMASAANSGKTNREIVTDWYTRYAEEIAGYENTLANLNIQLTQAQQDGDTARADGLQGQIADYTSRENIAKGQCSIPELGLQGFDAVSQTYNKIEQYREALEQAQQSYQNSATSASRSVDNAETKLEQSQREDDTLTNLQTALENCTLTATMDGTITALDATVGAVCSGTVATIQDVDNLTVEVTIPASSVGRLKTGLQCNITSDATDDTVTGTLTRIDPVANDSGSFGATVTVNGQDSGLLVGIPAKVEIVISTKDNVFTVPRDAVGTNDDGSTYVLRKTGGEGVDMTFEQVAVTEGDTNDYYVEITGNDLNEGDVIRATADLTQGIESGTSDSDVQMMENGDLYVGDGSNMANSLIVGGLLSGMKVDCVCPHGYRPAADVLMFAHKYGSAFRLLEDPAEGVKDADVVVTAVWNTAAPGTSESESRLRDFAGFQLTSGLLKAAKPDCMVLHCLPAHRGEEISTAVFEAHADEIFTEAENRLHVQKAVLAVLLAGK